MKRLTKAECENAATELAKIAFDKKIEEAGEKLKKVGDELITLLIPMPLLACLREYKEYFTDKSNRIVVRSRATTYSSAICCTANDVNPIGERKIFLIDDKTYKYVQGLRDEERSLRRKKENYKTEVSDVLYALRTKRRIEESFPEALPYLSFDDEKSNLPAPKFDNLRSLLK